MELMWVKEMNRMEMMKIITMLDNNMKRKEMIDNRELDLQTRKRISSYQNCRSAAQLGSQLKGGEVDQSQQERAHAARVERAHNKAQQLTTVEQLQLQLLVQAPTDRLIKLISNALQALRK